MDLRTELCRVIDADRVLTEAIDRIAWANDASVYRLVPRAVVFPQDIDEVRSLFRFSQSSRIPLTFRAAGTSLSGQAITDGVLVVLSRHWDGVEVRDAGARVWVQPGIVGGVVNRHLQGYGSKIGPDPASINACMMGGILANNSSGMCCGVAQNAYHTLHAMRFVLPDGLVVDTAQTDAGAHFERDAPRLAAGLLDLQRRIRTDAELVAAIRRKYGMKNTMGYSLNAFLDYERPIDILAHLMIGSEGTLGFIADAVLDTVPDYPEKYTGLLFFDDVPSACTAIAPLRDSRARALELMDRASLRAIPREPGIPAAIDALGPTGAALLVEYQCENDEELALQRAACAAILPGLPLAAEPVFTDDPAQQAALWRARKGLIPSVGTLRKPGQAFILEDVVYPVEHLADAVRELQGLLTEYRYDDAIVFGHAKDGNLHFVVTQAFEDDADVERYDGFMQALAANVTGRHGGALKAEHGTGRNMAPFVAREWGEHARAIMADLKRLVDPAGLLNPDVLINDDPRAHVTHLKTLPQVQGEIDRCIECGFCERVCPSRDLTLTPRQRIVVRREIARLRVSGADPAALRELERDFDYAAIDTCAADGLCALACPVSIDTGAFIKQLRAQRQRPLANRVATAAATHFGWAERLARGGLRVGHAVQALVGETVTAAAGGWVHRLTGGAVPPWRGDLPRAARRIRPNGSSASDSAVYFPTCASRVFADDGTSALAETALRVARRAQCTLQVPGTAGGHCCGMAFSSKGFDAAYQQALERTIGAMWDWSDGGRLPLVVDASPCAYTLKQAGPDLPAALRERYDQLQILDAIEWAHDTLLPRLTARQPSAPVLLHPVCSVQKMDLGARFERLVEAFAERADTPIATGCCGFAGDRGFAVPELTAAATRGVAAEVAGLERAGYYSSSTTCEIGMRRATGRPYRSFWHLLDETTR